jgi:hypothetical protein
MRPKAEALGYLEATTTASAKSRSFDFGGKGAAFAQDDTS